MKKLNFLNTLFILFPNILNKIFYFNKYVRHIKTEAKKKEIWRKFESGAPLLN